MSSYDLPEGFPHHLTDQESRAALDQIMGVIRSRYGSDIGPWLPELQLALLSVGLTDQARRQLVKGGRIAAWSLAAAVAVLVVAVIAVLVS